MEAPVGISIRPVVWYLLSQKVNKYFILLRFVFLLIGLWKTCMQQSGFAENMKREK